MNYEEAAKIRLNTPAVNVAIDAATEANRAGEDNQAQLVIAIKVYLLTCSQARIPPFIENSFTRGYGNDES